MDTMTGDDDAMTEKSHVPRGERPVPSLVMAMIPVVALVVLLGLAYYLFGDGAAAGPNQIALLS